MNQQGNYNSVAQQTTVQLHAFEKKCRKWLSEQEFKSANSQKRAYLKAIQEEFSYTVSEMATFIAVAFNTDPVNGVGTISIGTIQESRTIDGIACPCSRSTVENHIRKFKKDMSLVVTPGGRKNIPRHHKPANTYRLTGYEYKLEDCSAIITHNLNSSNPIDINYIIDHSDLRCNQNDLYEEYKKTQEVKPTKPPKQPRQKYKPGKYLHSESKASQIEMSPRIEELIDIKFRRTAHHAEMKKIISRLKTSDDIKEILIYDIAAMAEYKRSSGQVIKNMSAYTVQSFKHLLEDMDNPDNALRTEIKRTAEEVEEKEIPDGVYNAASKLTMALCSNPESSITIDAMGQMVGDTSIGILVHTQIMKTLIEREVDLENINIETLLN